MENDQVVWESSESVNPFALQAQAFVRAVQERDPSPARSPYPQALNSLAAVLGANASAEQGGRAIVLEEWVAGMGWSCAGS